jgi:hypothetical protein
MSEPNGTGEGKSLAELAVRRRQEIRPKKEVTDAAKLLFDDLTDLCFLSKHSVGFGVVRAGKPDLAERLGKSVATITRAQKELTPAEIWTKTGWYEGHEITIWFLRGIADSQLEFDQFTEGVTRRPRIRVAPRVQVARNGHGHFCKVNGSTNSPEKEQLTVDLTVHPGQSCGVATVNPDGATPSTLTVVNGQNHGIGPVNLDRGERSKLTGVNGQTNGRCPSKTDAGSPSRLTGYKKDSDIRNGEKAAPPSDSALQEWIKGLKNRKPQLLPRELQDIKTKLLEDRRKTPGIQARLFINAKIKAVDELMYGPTPPSETRKAGPVRVVPKPKMNQGEMIRRWKAAKKSLHPSLKQKAAATAAA